MKRFLLLTGLGLGLHSGYSSGAKSGCRDCFIEYFAESSVLLVQGDTLRGRVSLHHELDMLTVTDANNKIRALAAAQVKIFAVRGWQIAGKELIRNERQSQPSGTENVYEPPMSRRVRHFVWPSQAWAAVTMQSRYSTLKPNQHPVGGDSAAIRIYRVCNWDHDKLGQRPYPAFFEQLSNGPYLLLRRQKLEPGAVENLGYPQIIPPVVTDIYYLVEPDNTIIKLQQPQKDVLRVFSANSKAIVKYASEHRLRFDNSTDLIAIVEYANGLMI